MENEDIQEPTGKVIDWELVERDWRAGVKSQNQLATEHSVSRAAMVKRFKKLGIDRNLGAKIHAETTSRMAKAAVPAPALTQATERDIVDANAAMQETILLSHRKDIQRSRRLAMAMLHELELQTDNIDLLEEFAEIMYAPDDKGVDRRNELYRKIISLSSRAGTMKTLADSMRGLVALEREAFGLNAGEKESERNTGVEDVIKRVQAKHGGD